MDQLDVIAFLSDGASYGKPGIVVERIATHISIIFLIGDRAYKLKRAVSFSYLDYSTTAVREKFCKAELELNRRTAPAIYLRVRAVGRGPHGKLAFDDGSIMGARNAPLFTE
jgi:aminoglycoside phosphotransferase family enzyme